MNALPYIDAWLEAEADNAELRRLLTSLLVAAGRIGYWKSIAADELEERAADELEERAADELEERAA